MFRVLPCVGVAALLVGLSFAPEARADSGCGDFGAIGVIFGGAGGLGSTLIAGFVSPAIARAANPKLRYWPGVGYTMLGGLAGTIAGIVMVSGDCPFPQSMYIPSVTAVPAAAITTVIWGFASAPAEEPGVSLYVATPRLGSGALLGISARL